MRKVFINVFVMACIFSSCNKEESIPILDENLQSIGVVIADKNIEIVNGTLSFDSYKDLEEISDSLIVFTSTKSRASGTYQDFPQLQKLREAGFVSLYDLYVQALNDVDAYYTRSGGYEEFKEKYSTLFFPEVGDDYSPYLPISDKKLAMLADINGNVLIDNEIVSLRDITTYQQLKDLGQTPPEGAETLLDRGDVVYGTNNISKQRVGENMVWIKTHYEEKDGFIPVMMVEVCFRKKYGLVWSNHNSNTTAKLEGAGGLQLYAGKDHESAVAIHGISSHDYWYSIPTIIGNGCTVPVNQMVVIEHGGTGLTLKLLCTKESYKP